MILRYLLTPVLEIRLQLYLENWGILFKFLIFCGCDVQQDTQKRAQICATALNIFFLLHIERIFWS